MTTPTRKISKSSSTNINNNNNDEDSLKSFTVLVCNIDKEVTLDNLLNFFKEICGEGNNNN